MYAHEFLKVNYVEAGNIKAEVSQYGGTPLDKMSVMVVTRGRRHGRYRVKKISCFILINGHACHTN